MKTRGSPPRYQVDVLEKALDVLDLLKKCPTALRLTEIAERAGLHASTAFRLLRTFEHRGYVVRDRKSKRYQLSLGFRAYKIGFAQLSDDQPFSRKVTQGLLEAAEKARVELVVADNRNNAETTIKNAKWLIAQKVDFVIEYHFHHRVGPVLAHMFSKANVPCLAIDIPQPGAIYFGVDNYSAGHAGGEALARFAKQKWKGRVDCILMLEIPDAGQIPKSRVIGTIRGIREILPEVNERSVRHRNGKGTESGGYSSARRVIGSLASQERLLIAAANDNCARGAIRAVREARRERTTAIMAQGWGPGNGLEEEMQKPGSPLIGAVAYYPETYGPAILSVALKSLNGQPVPPAVYTKHVLINKEGIPVPEGRPASSL